MFLTVPEDGSREMFVNFHVLEGACAPHDSCSPVLEIRTGGSDETRTVEPTAFAYPGVEQRASRTLYTATLLDLEPGTEYTF